MPAKKKPPTEKAKATRTRSRARGADRKTQRVAAQQKRHEANVQAGTFTHRVHVKNADNMKLCQRCAKRIIVAGSVCWCRTIGDTRKG